MSFSNDFRQYFSKCVGFDGKKYYLPIQHSEFIAPQGASTTRQKDNWKKILKTGMTSGVVAEYDKYDIDGNLLGSTVFFSSDSVMDKLSFPLPDAGWINKGANSYYVSITGQRQYHKGATQSVVKRFFPNSIGRRMPSPKLKDILRAFNKPVPDYQGLDKSIPKLIKHCLDNNLEATQVSNDFILIRSAEGQFDLYFRDKVIVQTNDKGKILFGKYKNIYDDLIGGKLEAR